MSGNIRLPDHYRPRTIGSIGPDEIIHVPSHAFSADYLTRSLFINSHFPLRSVEHDQVDPATIDDDYYTQQKIEKYVGVMGLFLATGPAYVADLRSLDMNEVYWSELEETSEEPDPTLYQFPGLDMIDYNRYAQMNTSYKPLGAAAIIGLSGEVEFHGSDEQAIDAARYLVEELDYLKEALAHYIENNRHDYSYGYDGPDDADTDETDKSGEPVQFEYDIFDDI